MNSNHLFKLISMLVVVLSGPAFSSEPVYMDYPNCNRYYVVPAGEIDWGAVTPEQLQWKRLTPEQLISDEIDVNEADIYGATPLHVLAGWNDKDVEMFAKLLERGADINAQDKEGNTPVHNAINCSEINIEIVKFLLRNGADVSIKNEFGIAVANSMNRLGVSLLYILVAQDDVELILLLLKNGADVDFMGIEDSVWSTPLHNAVSNFASSEMIALLLRHDANPNTTSSMFATTPLHTAVSVPAYSQHYRQNKIDTVRLLLQHGADPNAPAPSFENHPPLFGELAGLIEPKVYSLLLEYGADANVRGYLGMTPLHFLLRFRHHDEKHIKGFQSSGDYSEIDDIESYYFQLITDSALILLEAGAEVNAKTDEGDTPLHYAVQHSPEFNPEIISILLNNGADANIKNNAGMTALQVGESNEHFVNSEAYQLLREHTTIE